jgi:hypothetical protein
MATATRAGRNDTCPCGSGKKFKKCCERKVAATSRGGRLWMGIVAVLLLGGIGAAVASFNGDGSRPQVPGQVWSPEHGHFH